MNITLPLAPTPDDLAHFDVSGASYPHLKDPENPIRQRMLIERAVIRRAVEDLLAAGKTLRVFYGHENGDSSDYGGVHTTDLRNVMSQIQACDEEWLNVYIPSPDKPGFLRFIGQIALVYGNDGWDVIADNHVSLEPWLKGAEELAEAIADAQQADLNADATAGWKQAKRST